MTIRVMKLTFVFVDYMAVSHPAFTTESFRGTLATTRARGFTILVLNRGLFVGWETRDTTRKRANEIFRLYDFFASNKLVVRVPCCLYCQTHEHDTATCPEEKPSSGEYVCKTCANKNGHIADTCPTRSLPKLFYDGTWWERVLSRSDLHPMWTRGPFLLQVYHRRYFLQTVQLQRSHSVGMPKPPP
ncbi:CCHC-type domain-containing protein [Fusarium falciforme]|uniref:CCHC-type domain-containing protein n=1 Tax=Fusarium falciforme TaxID=195108 RepID=UPI0023019510|nr:CCHC-type domain-containing protein [Fusarium falciforme]WAO88246.1 CCHC-type domain-containing protein [Fusarium falciforme]